MATEAETIQQINKYYAESPGYLKGPLGGTCHFGFTPRGEQFDLKKALYNMEKRLVEALHLPPGSLVGDFGCGYGRVEKSVAIQGGLKVVGIDLSSERTKEARRFNDSGVFFANQTQVIRGSYCDLPLPSGLLDGGYTMETLCHAPDLQRTLKEFKRVLRPGGIYAGFEYSIPAESSLDPVRKYISDVMIDRIGMASIKQFTHDGFPKIFAEAGFVNIKVKDIRKNVDPTWEWMFWEAVKRIPDLPNIITKGDKTNYAASLMMWPYRHFLGYKIITANKPL